MANLDFPASPTLDQTYTLNGRYYRWNGTAWVSLQPGVSFIEVSDPSEIPAGAPDNFIYYITAV